MALKGLVHNSPMLLEAISRDATCSLHQVVKSVNGRLIKVQLQQLCVYVATPVLRGYTCIVQLRTKAAWMLCEDDNGLLRHTEEGNELKSVWASAVCPTDSNSQICHNINKKLTVLLIWSPYTKAQLAFFPYLSPSKAAKWLFRDSRWCYIDLTFSWRNIKLKCSLWEHVVDGWRRPEEEKKKASFKHSSFKTAIDLLSLWELLAVF